MIQIFKQYGGAIICCMAFGMLTFLLFHGWKYSTDNSVLTYVGQRTITVLDERQIDYDAQVDKQRFDARTSRKNPTIKVKHHVKAGQSFNIIDTFLIKDDDGYTWSNASGAFVLGSDFHGGSVTILSIMDGSGVEYLSTYDTATGKILLLNAGNYTVRLCIKDCENITVTYRVVLSVDLPVS